MLILASEESFKTGLQIDREEDRQERQLELDRKFI